MLIYRKNSNNNYLLTEREVCMGKYQTKVSKVRTERSEVRTRDRGLIFSRTDRASEVNKSFIIHLLSLLFNVH